MVTLLLLAEYILHVPSDRGETKLRCAKFRKMIDISLQTTGCCIAKFYPQSKVKKTPVLTKLPDSFCIKIVEVNNVQWKTPFQDLQTQLYANTISSPKQE